MRFQNPLIPARLLRRYKRFLADVELATGEQNTTSKTGRRAIVDLLRHYNRLHASDDDLYPVVRLKASGFQHKRVGWVATPLFVIVGKAPRNSAAKPDTSIGADMNDELPWQ
jgi:hypothetical protein